MVPTFTVTDCVPPLLTCTDEPDKVQVGGPVVTGGVIAQLKFTVPEKELLEASVSAKLAVCPALTVWEVGDPEAGPRVKSGDPVSVSVSGVVCVRLPEVPVTVTVPENGVAVALAVSVSVLLLVAGFGLKAAVTPLGNPEAESDTLPLNPFSGVIVIVLVP